MTRTKPAWALTPTHKVTETFAGGAPYLAEGETWPKDEGGNTWRFLVQIALEDVPDLGLNLPQEGYLQFFHQADDLYGMSFDDPSDPSKGSKIFVRHVVDVSDQGDHIPEEFLKGEEEHYTPLEHPEKRVYYQGKLVSMKPFENSLEGEEVAHDDEDDSESFIDRVKEWLDDGGFVNAEQEDEESEDEGTPLSQEEYEFHLGGYANFTQADWRSDPDEVVLLLGSESDRNIMWGDMGVASFWLKSDDEADGAFDKTFIYWDCY